MRCGPAAALCAVFARAFSNPPPCLSYDPPVYEITVEDEFCAAHAIVIRGEREPVHGHNWKVSVTVAGEKLDADGLLLDFHALEKAVRAILDPFRNNDLNATPPFDRINPTAELVAKHIADRVNEWLSPQYRGSLRANAVRVTEAPGCSVVYRP